MNKLEAVVKNAWYDNKIILKIIIFYYLNNFKINKVSAKL